MLDRDRSEGREGSGLPEHALGEVRVETDALPLAGAERSLLVPDRIRDAQPAEIVEIAGAPHGRRELGQPVLHRPARGELGDRLRVAEQVRRLQVDEVRDGEQRSVQPVAVQREGESRLGLDDRVPGDDRVEVREELLRLGVDEVAQRRIELPAAPLAHERAHRRRPSRSASRSAIRHWRRTCSSGCPNPRSTPSDSAATSSASRTGG
jgi:hypothetical protein